MKTTLAKCAYCTRKLRKGALPTTIASQLLHILKFGIKQPNIQFKKGMLIFSIDIDVGNKELGIINKGKNDNFVNKYFEECEIGKIEEQAIPLLLKAFNEYKVPVTFAVRGQLTELDNTFFPLIRESPVEHDIGAHGYTHRKFDDLSKEEASVELDMLSTGMKRHGFAPKSFVFPRNAVSHLDLLNMYGYECYREPGNLMNDGMYIRKESALYDVHPSLYLTRNTNLTLAKWLLNIAISKKAPCHLWCHPWSFGETVPQINAKINHFLIPFLKYAAIKNKNNQLDFETMLSASREARMLLEKN